jgi:hypothetical protein
MFFMKPAPESQPNNHPTMPAQERGTRSQPTDNDTVRWMWLADLAEVVAETEALARKEQAAIKRRIRRTVAQVKRQSKSKQ